jgi:hypothetical protein
MISSIREARARVDGEGALRARGWRRLVLGFVVAWIERLGRGLLVGGCGERGAVSVPSIGSKDGCNGFAS